MRNPLVILAALGNLFSALCAGSVLAVFIEREEFRSIDVILTYIVGASLSLLALRLAGRFIRRGLPLLSLCASATFCLLALNVSNANFNYAIVSLLFGLLFIPRTLRTEMVGETTQALPIVEFAYSAGYLIAFLIPMTWYGDDILRMTYVGVALALTAGALDFCLMKFSRGAANDGTRVIDAPTRLDIAQLAPILRFCGLTVGCQLALQTLAAEFRTTHPLVGFELGTTLAPLAYAGLAARLPRLRITGVAAILVTAFAGLALSLHLNASIVVACALIASFIYEYAAISLLQSLADKHGAIARAFAINAAISSIIYWLCQHIPTTVGPAHYTLLALGAALTCASLLSDALLPLTRRNLHAGSD